MSGSTHRNKEIRRVGGMEKKHSFISLLNLNSQYNYLPLPPIVLSIAVTAPRSVL